MKCNGIFTLVLKYMECIHFEHSRSVVPKRSIESIVFMHLTYPVIDERKIDRITPGREKINLRPKPLPRLCPVITSNIGRKKRTWKCWWKHRHPNLTSPQKTNELFMKALRAV